MKIIDRQLAFASNHSDRDGAPVGIVLHHAAGSGTVEAVHAYHRNENGWAGIGYHFYIRKDGNVYRGRPETWLGAHTSGHNDMLGICVEGNYDTETMPSVQQNAVVDLIAYLKKTYGNLTVYAHRELDSTSCPGEKYPLDAILNADKTSTAPSAKNEAVFEFQQAAIADSLPLNVYGADGIWGMETASAASALVKNGSVGSRVMLIQQMLVDRGYDLGQYGRKKNGVDAHFGDKTEKAVRAFQAKNGLAVDGIVGIETWKALLGVTV